MLVGDQTQHLLFRLVNGELPAESSTAVWKNVVVLIGVNNLRAGMTAEEVILDLATCMVVARFIKVCR